MFLLVQYTNGLYEMITWMYLFNPVWIKYKWFSENIELECAYYQLLINYPGDCALRYLDVRFHSKTINYNTELSPSTSSVLKFCAGTVETKPMGSQFGSFCRGRHNSFFRFNRSPSREQVSVDERVKTRNFHPADRCLCPV